MKPRIHDFWRHLPTKKIVKIATAIILIQTVYLLTMHNQLMDMFVDYEDFPTMKPINYTFEDVDAIKYIQDILNGKAEVAPVVEAEKYPEIYLGCSMDQTANVTRGWITNGRWYLYSAYEDGRPNSLYPKLKTVIQIIASTYYVVDPSERWYCHIRNFEGDMLRVRAHFREIWQRAWDARRTFYNPYLITCALPNDYPVYKGAVVMLRGKKCPNVNETFLDVNLISKAVDLEDKNGFKASKPIVLTENGKKIVKVVESMVRNRFEIVKLKQIPTNLSKDPEPINDPIQIPQTRLKIAVCVKGMDFFEDRTYDLIEWLLFQYKLGADSVTLYIYHLPDRTLRMLDEMAKEYDLRLIHLDLPGNVSMSDGQQHEYIWQNPFQKRRNELIPYNDCFYSYIHTHDYVLIVDTDEIIVPIQEENWNDMIANFIRGFRQNATSLSARNVFKFPKIGDGFGMTGRRTRAAVVQDKGDTGKSFISTQTAATVFNHFALHRLHGNVARTAYFPSDTALKLHYKTNCPKDFDNECEHLKNSSIIDHSLDRWNDEIAHLAKEMLKRVD